MLMLKNKHSTVHIQGMGMGTGSDRSTRQARPWYSVGFSPVAFRCSGASQLGGEAANPGAGAAGGR